MSLFESILELIRVTSCELPSDVTSAIKHFMKGESPDSNAHYAMNTFLENIKLAMEKNAPICQDTGTNIYHIYCPEGFSQLKFIQEAENATVNATEKGYLRQNSVDTLSGKNTGNNLGRMSPVFHFHVWDKNHVEVKLMLKGGGCENVGAQYSLPNIRLDADRNLEGVRKVILDSLVQAQGKGCGPGIIGVCIGGDRTSGYEKAKELLLRKLDDENPDPQLNQLEHTIMKQANNLGIGPMGFGGNTTLLGCKIDHINRLPASYFVSISYMCWAYRRQGIRLTDTFQIDSWLYDRGGEL
jgi:fumarate hydratase class I